MASVAFLSIYSGVVDRGVETFVIELSKRLSKKYNVSIFQAGSAISNKEIRTYTLSAFASKPVQSKNPLSKIYLDVNSIRILFFTLACLPKLLKNRFDVIIPLNGGWQIVLIKIISAFTKSRVIVSGQAGIGADDAWNLFLRPDIFVALTTSQKNWAQAISPEQQMTLIPNGVDLSKFNSGANVAKLSLPRPIVVCVSALVPNKRIDLTIRAVAKAKLSLLLIGDGQLKGVLDNLGKRLLGKKYLRVVVSYSEIQKYYRLGNVFSLVSKNEAFGTSYIEALACNLPAVATNDESRGEIIGNAGILTDPENIDIYAKDLVIAAKTNYRNIPYNQALKFSWNKIGIEYSRMIKKITTENDKQN